MASGSRSLTIHDLSSEVTTVRLRLENKANELVAKKPHKSSFIKETKEWISRMFNRAEEELEPEATKEATERNKAKMRDIFEKIRNKLNEQERDVLGEMERMTPQQQEDTITFWSGVQEFFMDLFNWLKTLWDTVLEKIREGWRVVKEAVKGLFNFREFFNMVF